MLEIRNVLAATDLTAASDRVVRTAAEAALRSDASLHVVHVVELPPGIPVTVFSAAPALDPARYAERQTHARQTLQEQLERVVPAGLRCSPELVEGEPVPGSICRRAEELPADLIVIGPHREENGTAGPLGTTADDVLRSAPVPVLVVRGTGPVPAGRVLAAVDPGEFSPEVVQAAVDWAGAFSPPADGAPPGGAEVVYAVLDLVTGPMPFDRARVLRGPAGGPLPAAAAGAEPAEVVLWGGSVVETLLAYARETGPDLLVAGSHARGAIKRALLGGTSSALARRAPCSVLLLPPRLWSGSAEQPGR